MTPLSSLKRDAETLRFRKGQIVQLSALGYERGIRRSCPVLGTVVSDQGNCVQKYLVRIVLHGQTTINSYHQDYWELAKENPCAVRKAADGSKT